MLRHRRRGVGIGQARVLIREQGAELDIVESG
jgi:hypothetical protein